MPGTLSPEDLNSAVEAGVIDAAQAEKLKAMRTQKSASDDSRRQWRTRR